MIVGFLPPRQGTILALTFADIFFPSFGATRATSSRRPPSSTSRKETTHDHTTKAWLLLIPAILVEVMASLALKGALEHPALYVVVVIGYLSGFILLAKILRTGMALGVAYGIWGATGVALTAVGSLLIFGEPITALMGIGIIVIIAGVLCVELGAQAAHKKAEMA